MAPSITRSPSVAMLRSMGFSLGDDLDNIAEREHEDRMKMLRRRRMAAMGGQSAAAKLLANMGKLNLQ
jgi:hypothetical protein